MKGTTFSADLSEVANLAIVNSRAGLVVRVELGKSGFVVAGTALSKKRPVVRDYNQVVSYQSAELSDGGALAKAIRKVVTGLGFEFLKL